MPTNIHTHSSQGAYKVRLTRRQPLGHSRVPTSRGPDRPNDRRKANLALAPSSSRRMQPLANIGAKGNDRKKSIEIPGTEKGDNKCCYNESVRQIFFLHLFTTNSCGYSYIFQSETIFPFLKQSFKHVVAKSAPTPLVKLWMTIFVHGFFSLSVHPYKRLGIGGAVPMVSPLPTLIVSTQNVSIFLCYLGKF